MDDLISRLAVITLPVMPKEHREYQTCNLDDAYEQGWNDLQKCIEYIPSAQRKGKWLFVEYPDGYFHTACSECGQWVDEDVYLKGKWNYCPNCGAEMEKEGEK